MSKKHKAASIIIIPDFGLKMPQFWAVFARPTGSLRLRTDAQEAH